MIAKSFPLAATTTGPAEREARAASTAGGVRAAPWHRVALGAILLLAAGLNVWHLDRLGYGNAYYAAAVKSMLLNWHNFFFNAFDPGGFVTIDKPPLGFWFQVASAKLFGYSGISLLLPEALAGVGSVAVLYVLVRRVSGIPAGLGAALFLALTPVVVVDSRNNTIDSTLVFFLLLGAWAVSKAAESGKLRWLLLCAVLVGLGFNIKMLEAYLVVPAFGLLYLLGTRLRWRTRLAHLALAAVLLLGVSLSWAVAVDLTPASQRPWVDSTSSNSEVDLALGYNGLERLVGMSRTGGAPPGQTSTITPKTTTTGTTRPANGSARQATGTGTTRQARTAGFPGGGGGGLFNNGAAGLFRLFNGELGGQASWLLPLALIGLVVAAGRRLRFPLDRQRQAVLLWGTWLLTVGAFFSVAGFFHSYYLITLAPAVAALAAIGIAAACRDYLAADGAWRAWCLPAALVVTAGAQAYILRNFPAWSTWITPLVVGLTLVAAGALAAMRLRRTSRPILWKAALAAGLLALLIAPAAWTIDTVAASNGGQIPAAGPAATSGGNLTPGAFAGGGPGFGSGGGPGAGSSSPPAGGANTGTPPQAPSQGGFGGFGNGGAGGPISSTVPLTGARGTRAGFPGGTGVMGGPGGRAEASVNPGLVRYLEQHQGTTTYLLAVGNSTSAAPYIIQTGKAVMSLGGFSGSNPILTTARLKTLIANNTVRYFLIGGGGGGRDTSAVTTWVQQSCKAVASSAWQTASTSGATGAATDRTAGAAFLQQQLYDCGGVARAAR